MPRVETMHELMIHELHDLYSAEKQLAQTLPKMVKRACAPELRDAFAAHLSETQEHICRLEQVFDALGVKAKGHKCKGMEGLIEEAKEWLDDDADLNVVDAGLISVAQRMEHYEIAAYGTAAEFARSMGHSDLVDVLVTTLNEEKHADLTLTKLAESGINARVESGMGPEIIYSVRH